MRLIHLMAGSLGTLALSLGSAQALTINLIDTGGVTGSAAEQGFRDAANVWESLLTDNVTVNLNVGFDSLGANVLAQTGSELSAFSFASTRNALGLDVTSVGDSIAVTNLAAGPTIGFLTNSPSNTTPVLDNDGSLNNAFTFMTRANARALDLVAAQDSVDDGSVTFNSDFDFDFDASDGISNTQTDFVGVAIHEIGHALGFVSGVDQVDTGNAAFIVTQTNEELFLASTLDLFRFSSDSALQDVIDLSADQRDKFFSIDGGATSLGTFSEGVNLGDGRQASHWKDNLGLGIMDPTFAPGEFGVITGLDLVAFDVIGWDLASATSVVPLPAALPLFLTALMGFGGFGYMKRRKAA